MTRNSSAQSLESTEAQVVQEPIGSAFTPSTPPAGGDGASETPWLDWVLEEGLQGADSPARSSEGGAAESLERRLLRMAFAGLDVKGATRDDQARARRWAKNRLGGMVATIDALVTDQVNAIIHHPRFQSLEASWRGLWQLVEQADAERTAALRIRVLSLSRRQWTRDLLSSTSFDSSALFQKVYEDEFGMAGGTPFGLMVADFEIGRNPEDWDALEAMAAVAAAAFCPTVLAASPTLLGLDSWRDLPLTQHLAAGFRSPQYARWNRMRGDDDAKYIGLALPRTLMRLPYDSRDTPGFLFHEDVSDPEGGGYLWGNAAYAFASVVMRSFAESRWLADIRGVERGVIGGGLVDHLPKASFGTDRDGVAAKCSVDVMLTDPQESELSSLGFLPLSHCQGTEFAAFHSSLSLQEPKKYDDPLVSANARIGSMLQYTLCVSRFAHYIKVIARDWIGSGKEARELQRFLDGWLKQYVADSEGLSNRIRAERPLRKAEVTVQRHPMQPGTYQCSIDLWPHYQIDQLSAAVQLRTTIVSKAAG